jgi:two-component sensor histidine kinase
VESDSISLPIDLANPCGMIVTELVGNAIRHAFPAGAGGVVRIWLKRRGGEIELGVADDGVGMPADEPARKGSGLGLETAGYIAEAQLGGKLELLPGAGTAWRIRFHAKEA